MPMEDLKTGNQLSLFKENSTTENEKAAATTKYERGAES